MLHAPTRKSIACFDQSTLHTGNLISCVACARLNSESLRGFRLQLLRYPTSPARHGHRAR